MPTVNNPTGTMTARDDLLRFLASVPEHVLTVVDEAYFEYVEDPAFPDAIEEAAKAGRRVLALRTFSKIYGLAGLRIGYGVGPAEVIAAIRKVQRAFDVTTPAQEAALASLDDAGGARPAPRASTASRWPRSSRSCASVASSRSGRPSGNFLFVDVGSDAAAFNDALLRRGVIVRPDGLVRRAAALRITAGTLDEIEFLGGAARRGRSRRPNRLRVRGLGYRSPLAARRAPSLSMRTTLKRGIGRGAALTATVASRCRRRPPPGHDLPAAAAAAAERLARSSCGSSAGRRSCSPCRGRHRRRRLPLPPRVGRGRRAADPEVKEAAKSLDVPLPGQPATALVIGYDRRADEAKNAPSRSDTLMLVRADPDEKTISMLSFPRDLRVEIALPRQGARSSTRSTPRTRRAAREGALEHRPEPHRRADQLHHHDQLPRLPQLVDKVGGVWMDIDRRYFNDRGGPSRALREDQPPAGLPAARTARGRSTSSASGTPTPTSTATPASSSSCGRSRIRSRRRSRSLGAAAGDQGRSPPTSRSAQGGGKDVSPKTVLRTPRSRTRCRPGTSSSRGSTGSRASPTSTTAPENIERAVREFRNPDVESPRKATAVALGEKLKQKAPPPRETSVTVLNGNGVEGSASTASYLLGQRGYRMIVPPNGLPANAPTYDFFRTEVYFDAARRARSRRRESSPTCSARPTSRS